MYIYICVHLYMYIYIYIFPKQSLLYGGLAPLRLVKVGRPLAPRRRWTKMILADVYRHRRFWLCILLQRGSRSVTRAAATATFSSLMLTKHLRESFFLQSLTYHIFFFIFITFSTRSCLPDPGYQILAPTSWLPVLAAKSWLPHLGFQILATTS